MFSRLFAFSYRHPIKIFKVFFSSLNEVKKKITKNFIVSLFFCVCVEKNDLCCCFNMMCFYFSQNSDGSTIHPHLWSVHKWYIPHRTGVWIPPHTGWVSLTIIYPYGNWTSVRTVWYVAEPVDCASPYLCTELLPFKSCFSWPDYDEFLWHWSI